MNPTERRDRDLIFETNFQLKLLLKLQDLHNICDGSEQDRNVSELNNF